jgi:hypothetical protein
MSSADRKRPGSQIGSMDLLDPPLAQLVRTENLA